MFLFNASPLLAVFGLGPMEMLIFGVIAVLLFGNRLPEVARSLGKGLTEFKKGIHGINDEIDTPTRHPSPPRYSDVDDHDEATAPKFEPPPAETPADAPADELAAEGSPKA